MEQLTLSKSYIVGAGIQRSILNMFGECTAIGSRWDLAEFTQKIKSDPGFKEFDIYKLSDAELIALGFGKISDECNIRLIPTWTYVFLPDQVAVYGKDSPEPVVIKKTQLGQPVLGYFGFGILAPGMEISNNIQQAIVPETNPENEVKVE